MIFGSVSSVSMLLFFGCSGSGLPVGLIGLFQELQVNLFVVFFVAARSGSLRSVALFLWLM